MKTIGILQTIIFSTSFTRGCDKLLKEEAQDA